MNNPLLSIVSTKEIGHSRHSFSPILSGPPIKLLTLVIANGWKCSKYYAIVRTELTIFSGREIDTAGDGFRATFEVPAQAIRRASAIRDGTFTLGLQIKAGLHAGECESLDDSIAGIAVHIGARVAAMAGPGEVLVSSTVKELVMGSGIGFIDHGTHTLKGIPGEWRLFLALGDPGDSAGPVAAVVPARFDALQMKSS